MLPFIVLWLIPSLFALGMLATHAVLHWRKHRYVTVHQGVMFFLGTLLSLLPLVSVLPLSVCYLIAKDDHDFGSRPLFVSQQLKNELVAARLRGDC